MLFPNIFLLSPSSIFLLLLLLLKFGTLSSSPATIFAPVGTLSPSPSQHHRRHTTTSISATQSQRFHRHSGEIALGPKLPFSGNLMPQTPSSPLQFSGNLIGTMPPQTPSSPWHLPDNIMSPFIPFPPSLDHGKLPFSGVLRAASLTGNLLQFGRRMVSSTFGGQQKSSSKIVGVRKCNCGEKAMGEMATIRFKSDKDEQEREVKVVFTEQPFGSGHQAELYDGCFVTNGRKRAECVAVKLVGTGTNEEKDEEMILEDPKNEIGNLLAVQKRHPDPLERRHIIHLHDGGRILEIKGKGALKHMGRFQYAVILESGGDNYLEGFVKFCKKMRVLTERSLIKFLEPSGETLVNVHKMPFIHMDWKPQNLLFVEEKVELDHSGRKYFFSRPKAPLILKAIDFGGAMLLDGPNWSEPSSSSSGSGSSNGKRKKLGKVTSTKHRMAPEMDWRFKMRIDDRKGTNADTDDLMPMASSKSDIWQFGIMVYNLIFVWQSMSSRKKPKSQEAATTDVVLDKLTAINDLYKEVNEIETVEDLHVAKLHINIETIESVLEVRSKYPRLFLLITNLLDKNEDERLSAKGVLEYLQGECRLPTKIDGIKGMAQEEEENVENNKFIGEFFTMEMLEKHYGGEQLAKAIQKGNGEMAKMAKKMEMEMRGKRVAKICDRGYVEDGANLYHFEPLEEMPFSPRHAIVEN